VRLSPTNARTCQFLKEDQTSRRDQTFPAAIVIYLLKASPTATGSRMASSPNHEPLPREGVDARDAINNEQSPTHSGPVQPPTYYGEGPFDPPNSEDEDESFLSKETRWSPGMVELVGYGDSTAKVHPYCSASH